MPSGLANGVPRGAGWIVEELAWLRQKLMEVAAARTLEAAQIGKGGLLIDGDGGLTVVDPATGHTVAYIGTTGFLDGSGRKQAAVELFRGDDGSAALALFDGGTAPGHPYGQAFQVYDRAGNIVMADDNTGKGLAKPYVDGGLVMANTNTATWPQTNSAAFTSIAFGYMRVVNPRLQWDIDTVADAATAGQIRLMINGTQVDTTQAIGTSFVTWTRYQVAMPAGINPDDVVAVDLQARRTSGAGKVYSTVYRISGDQAP